MKSALSKNKWKSVIKSALKQGKIRLNQENLEAWKLFSKLQIDLLIQLKDENVSFPCLLENHQLSELIQGGSQSYILNCLYATIENDDIILEDKFDPLLHLVLELSSNGKINYTSIKVIHEHLLLYIIEKENAKALKTLLSITNKTKRRGEETAIKIDGEIDENTHNNIDTGKVIQNNSDALIKACAKNNYTLVKLLVSAGYRYTQLLVYLKISKKKLYLVQ